MGKNSGMNHVPGTLKFFLAGLFMAFGSAAVHSQDQDATSVVQNAVLEGIQISAEPSNDHGEKIVTCYFIFKDKPSSYFYGVNKKKLVFEFNDTQKGSSPIVPSAEPPLEGFVIEQKKVDVNKEVKGLNQEWHDLIEVSFDLTKIPRIEVKDEYNVISFSYKWTTDPGKEKDYELKEESHSKAVVLGTVGAGGLIAGGVVWYFLTHKPSSGPEGPIPIDDLPTHAQ
jgi:hypothetical protein